MQIYHYNPTTHEYVSSQTAHADPLETIAQKKGVYLIPANATAVAPPEPGENQVAVYDPKTEAWALKPDHRGRVMYDQATGERHAITAIGDEPESGLTDTGPPNNWSVWDEKTGSWTDDLKLWLDAAVRPQRNHRLQQCDYILMPDYPMADKSAWETYRQQLRDLPGTLSDVSEKITWPSEPA